MTILKGEKLADLLSTKVSGQDPLYVTPVPDIEAIRNSGSASLDLRLGVWFTSLRHARQSVLDVDSSEHRIAKSHFVRFGDRYFLHPRNFVLGITLEWLRFPSNLAGYVIGKSSWGRRGLVIATATGVHPGFTGCLTLELCNVGEIPIELRPGSRICQLFVHTVEPSSCTVDRSKFGGRRKPVLGKMEDDALAMRLATEGP